MPDISVLVSRKRTRSPDDDEPVHEAKRVARRKRELEVNTDCAADTLALTSIMLATPASSPVSATNVWHGRTIVWKQPYQTLKREREAIDDLDYQTGGPRRSNQKVEIRVCR